MCVADEVGTRKGTDHGLHGSISLFVQPFQWAIPIFESV